MSTKRKISLSSPQPVKKERKTIDLDTKMKVIKQHEGGKKVNVIARDLKLSHSTVSTILKDKERIREAVKGSAPMQSTVITKQRTGPILEMEKLLHMWMEDQIQKRTPLSLFTVQTKAKSLFQTLKDRAGDDYTQDFVASTGWFARFKKRFQLHNVQVTGEAASADEEGARNCCSHDGQPGLTPKTKNKQTPESQHSKHQTLILKGMLEDVTFADVTLTAEGKSLKAHKAVLSAMSPYFKKVLQNNPSPHPIIIMPLDMQFEDLKGIIDYIYMGEIVVPTENLSSLFKAGHVLQVSGLTTVDTVGVKAPNAPSFDNDLSIHKDTSGATLSMETNQGSEIRLDTSRNEDANKLQSSHGSRKSKGSSAAVENVSERQKHKDKGANSTIVTVEAAEPSDNRNQKRPETVDSSETESFEKTPAQPLQARGSCTVISDDDSSNCMFMTDEETMSIDFDYKCFEEQEEELDPLQIHSHGSDDSFHQSASISNGQQCDSINFVTVKEELED